MMAEEVIDHCVTGTKHPDETWSLECDDCGWRLDNVPDKDAEGVADTHMELNDQEGKIAAEDLSEGQEVGE